MQAHESTAIRPRYAYSTSASSRASRLCDKLFPAGIEADHERQCRCRDRRSPTQSRSRQQRPLKPHPGIIARAWQRCSTRRSPVVDLRQLAYLRGGV
jgi:hypothetical protein